MSCHRQTLRTGLQTPSGGVFPESLMSCHRQTLRTGLQTPSGGRIYDDLKKSGACLKEVCITDLSQSLGKWGKKAYKA